MAAPKRPPPEPVPVCHPEPKPGRELRPEDLAYPMEDWKEGKDLIQPTHPGKQTAAA